LTVIHRLKSLRSISAFICITVLFGFIYSASAGAEEIIAGFSQERLKRLDNKLTSLVESNRYPGFSVLIMRDGKVAHKVAMGWQDKERKIEMKNDTIFRIYSMSKAITSIAALILFEQGHFQIDDPVDKFIPEFKNLRVYKSGEGVDIETVALQRPITFRDFFTHTSGLTYHFVGNSPVHQMYRDKGVLPGVEVLGPGAGDAAPINDLKTMITELSTIPLLHQPGERMSYSVSIDVLGHLIEIMSGQKFDDFLQQNLFAPLNMHDTGFSVAKNKLHRFAANYSSRKAQSVLVDDPQLSRYQKSGRILSGGAGLVSTSHDYMQFQLMILNGGKLGKVRILGPKTVDFALSNHFPKDNMTRPFYMTQQGHGLGFALSLDPARMGVLTSVGAADWAGAASTFFWIDRKERLAAVFMTQDMPITDNALFGLGRSLTYQALVE
jgi:CubicO group peptidase (beta-lactamase class C family)